MKNGRAFNKAVVITGPTLSGKTLLCDLIKSGYSSDEVLIINFSLYNIKDKVKQIRKHITPLTKCIIIDELVEVDDLYIFFNIITNGFEFNLFSLDNKFVIKPQIVITLHSDAYIERLYTKGTTKFPRSFAGRFTHVKLMA